MTASRAESTRRLTIVMPAYNELPNLRELLPRVHQVVEELPDLVAEIRIVIPSFAPDPELDELRSLGALPIRREPGDSFGDAIRTGISSADLESDYVIIMDADGSHDPSTIPRLLEHADDADVVVASRYTRGGTTDNSFMLRAMSRSLNLAYRLILGIECKDVSTNFKLYHRADLVNLTLTSKDFDIVEELLFRVKQVHGKSLRIIEIPDRFFERKHGTTKRQLGPFVVSYLRTLVKLSWLSGRPQR